MRSLARLLACATVVVLGSCYRDDPTAPKLGCANGCLTANRVRVEVLNYQCTQLHCGAFLDFEPHGIGLTQGGEVDFFFDIEPGTAKCSLTFSRSRGRPPPPDDIPSAGDGETHPREFFFEGYETFTVKCGYQKISGAVTVRRGS